MNDLDRELHRARLANLADDLPELGETLAEYLARMIHEHGTTYAQAAAERYRGQARREARAVDAAARELQRIMQRRKPGTEGQRQS